MSWCLITQLGRKFNNGFPAFDNSYKFHCIANKELRTEKKQNCVDCQKIWNRLPSTIFEVTLNYFSFPLKKKDHKIVKCRDISMCTPEEKKCSRTSFNLIIKLMSFPLPWEASVGFYAFYVLKRTTLMGTCVCAMWSAGCRSQCGPGSRKGYPLQDLKWSHRLMGGIGPCLGRTGQEASSWRESLTRGPTPCSHPEWGIQAPQT